MSGGTAPLRQRPAGARLSVRESVLNVALGMHAEGTWRRTAMWQIAAAAGVSRQTLYNEFGDRDGITRALLGRETNRLLDGTGQRWRQARGRGAEHGDCLAAAMSWFLAVSHSHPLLHDVLTGHGHGTVGTSGGRRLVDALTDLCRRLTDAAWPGSQPGRPDRLRAVEAVVRMTLSYLLVPAETHQQACAQIAHAARTLLPVTGSALGPAGGGTGDPASTTWYTAREREHLLMSTATAPDEALAQAELAYRDGQFYEAEAIYHELLGSFPRESHLFAKALRGRALALHGLGRFHDAEQELRRILLACIHEPEGERSTRSATLRRPSASRSGSSRPRLWREMPSGEASRRSGSGTKQRSWPFSPWGGSSRTPRRRSLNRGFARPAR
ncbi:TetR family transcriptional regulator (plasmid) [Streptomyces sp. NBC_00637]